MTREFRLPDVGEGVREGEIIQWLVEPGDEVVEDQPFVEVETDKAVVEIPSPVTGTVGTLHAAPGDIVPVGEVIITFETDEPVNDVTAADTAVADENETEKKRVFASPSARQLARELGVDINTISGSGPSGRVTEADIRQASDTVSNIPDSDVETEPPVTSDQGVGDLEVAQIAEDGDTSTTADRRPLAVPAARRLASEAGINIGDVPTASERDGRPVVTVADVEAAISASRAKSTPETEPTQKPGERIPYRGTRRTIGRAMVKSVETIPHVTHHDEVEVSELVRIRRRLNEERTDSDPRITYLPFVMKAVVISLKTYPIVNSFLDENAEEIVVQDWYNIGVATATDRGLLVPVVSDVDQKGIRELSADIDQLVQKARDSTIEREEMQGGTFSITNFGAIGGDFATPVINHPEVAILGLGAIKERPWVVDGAVVARETLPLSLSIDHRVLDGAVGASFVNRVKHYLHEPSLLLMEL